MTTVLAELRANRLLSLLDDATLGQLAPDLQRESLPIRTSLYEDQQPMDHAWFPVDGLLSILGAGPTDTRNIEVATIGREGVLGVPLFLGAQLSLGAVFVQVSGAGYRMPAPAFLAAAGRLPDFAGVLHRYTYALMAQVMQGTACNRTHPVEQRCARWLLQTHDRVHGDEFDLTQEFLGQMIGERRATVNQVATELQQRGLIRYTRGRIGVVDRAGLEQASCPCYGIVRTEYERMLNPPAPSR